MEKFIPCISEDMQLLSNNFKTEQILEAS